jgi:hypothetical protein
MFTKHTHYHCATRVLGGWLGLLVGWLGPGGGGNMKTLVGDVGGVHSWVARAARAFMQVASLKKV